jgi:phage gp36-like protein
MNRRMFIDEQASLDMAFGCISEAHIWEALNDAVKRLDDYLGWSFRMPKGQYGFYIIL